MLANNRHTKIGALLTTVFLGQRITIVARIVGQALGLRQQRFPLFVRQATSFPVGSRVFPAVIKKPYVVVLVLKGLDRVFDKQI